MILFFKNKLIPPVFFVLLICSCKNEVVLNISPQRQLVVLSNFSPEKPLKLTLQTTNPVSDGAFDYPTERTVQLFVDDLFIENLNYVLPLNLDTRPFYTSSVSLEANREYSIQIEKDELFSEVTASSIIPQKPPLPELNLTEQSVVFDSLDSTIEKHILETRIRFPKSVSNDQYYHLVVYRNIVLVENDTTLTFLEYLNPRPVSMVPYTILSSDTGVLIDESDFDTEEIEMSTRFSFSHHSASEIKTPIIFELRKITSDYYYFHKSLEEQNANNIETALLYVHPVAVHNNINGGVGNFSAYNEAIDSIIW